jgi:uncharacterized zinc-type alcohol dehydrogenase-like protein
MTMSIECFAALAAGQALEPFAYEPPALGPEDVEITITHCGICHSDIHMIDNEWDVSCYPLVPGHEIIGHVSAAGAGVKVVRVGDRVGVGWQCASCLNCEWCRCGEEPCCAQTVETCVGRHGGFARAIRVDGRFVHRIPEALESSTAAPLLCAGATVYTPLKAHVRAPSRVGVIGIGGLGHLAIRFARAFGSEVTAFSTTPEKETEAREFGADHFVLSNDAGQMERAAGSFDFLLSTVTAKLDWPVWVGLLRPKGVLCLVGASPGTLDIPPASLIIGQRMVCGSAIGSRSTIREMLDFAARHGITPRIECMPLSEVNAALDKVRGNRARYRVVLTV